MSEPVNKNISNPELDLYNKEIDEAIIRVESGEYFTHEEVEKLANDW
jgi:hypothetical protein